MSILSRKSAIDAGEKFYFTGVPCKYGHVTPRYTKNKSCVGCVPNRNRAAYALNRNARCAASRAWHWANRAHNNARRKANSPYQPGRDATYHAAHRGARNAHTRIWRKNNGDRVNEASSRKRALVKQATPAWANRAEMLRIYREAKKRGANFHVDHTVPLRSKLVCGLHCEDNLRIIPAAENTLKRNTRWPDMP